jgi:signal transduction histidine kinase
VTRGRWWLAFGLCSAAVLVALGWMTREMLRLERAELEARVESDFQESLRLALWRMDSWIAPRIAQESARPYFEYTAYYPQARAYTRILNTIEPGEVLTPSPLLTYESDLFLLHFQWRADGEITSPQVPASNLRELAEVTFVSPQRIAEKETTLASLRALLGDSNGIEAALAAADARMGRALAAPPLLRAPAPPAKGSQQEAVARTKWEATKRAVQSDRAQIAASGGGSAPGAGDRSVRVGPLVPIWLDEFGTHCGNVGDPIAECVMILARRVDIGGASDIQGIMLGWPALREALLAEVADLFPNAELEVVRDATDLERTAGRALASIPLALDAPRPSLAASASGLPWARGPIVLIWVATLLTLAAIAFTVRASLAYAERRSRFASAVTHELRTPLTTFQMYTDMLAGGMVRSEEQRQAYLETLRDESGRLATLVENVLAYARLERGHVPSTPHDTTLGALVERLEPALGPRLERAGMRLSVDLNGSADTAIIVDEEAVQQILANLVENACKYASGAETPTIELEGDVQGTVIVLRVRDHGPGITAREARTIFRPFERGTSRNGEAPTGVGLGLALSRGLARQLGGDLQIVPCDGGGACFELRLPRRAARGPA